MTTREKLIQKLADKRRDENWSAEELATVLKHFGYTLRGIAGSHHLYTNPANGMPTLSIPAHGKKIKSGYPKLVRKAVL